MNILSTIKEIFRHGSIYMSGLMLNSVLRLALLPIFTRYINRSEYGMISLLDTAVSFIQIVCAFGVESAIIRFFHEYEKKDDQNKVISTGLVFVVFMTGITGCLLYSFHRPLTRMILGNADNSHLVLLAIATMLFGLLRSSTDAYFTSQKASAYFVLASSGQLILSSSINLYLLIIKDMGIFGMLIGNLIASSVVNIILFFIVIKSVSFYIDLEILKKMLKFSMPLMISMLAAAGIHNIDRFFIRIYASMSDLGIYSLGYQFPFMLYSILAGSFERIWGASTIFTVAKFSDAKYRYKKICTYYMVLVAFALYSISIGAETIVGIFAASEYSNAAKYIPIISMGIWIYSLHVFLKTGVLISKKTYLFSINYIFTFIMNVILNLLFVPKYGAMGAAISTLGTYSCFSFFGYFIYKTSYPLSIEWCKILIIACVGCFLFLVHSMIHIENYLYRTFLDIISIIMFPITLYMIPNFLSRGEKRELYALKQAGLERLRCRQLLRENGFSYGKQQKDVSFHSESDLAIEVVAGRSLNRSDDDDN